MNNSYMNAMVVDESRERGQIFAQLIGKLFSDISVQTDISGILENFKGTEPLIVFFNLSLSQRTNSFEWKGLMPLNEKNPTIYFGFLESHEPEIVAHAIESGFHDIFFRPFDADMIATKINRFVQNEKSSDKGIKHVPLRTPFTATTTVEAKLMNIDESGLSFFSPHYVSKGATFTVCSPLMAEIFDKNTMEMMVTKTWMGKEWNEFYLFAEPKNHNEETSNALRRYILKKL